MSSIVDLMCPLHKGWLWGIIIDTVICPSRGVYGGGGDGEDPWGTEVPIWPERTLLHSHLTGGGCCCLGTFVNGKVWMYRGERT